MAPDLNSLPPSRSTTTSPLRSRRMSASRPSPHERNTPSPRGSISLAAAATMNAADRSRRSSASQHMQGSPQLTRLSSEQRRAQVATNLLLSDPALPSPGEMSSPEHRSSIGHSFSAASPSSLGGRGTIATGDPHHQRQPSLGDIHNELEQEQEAQVNRMLQMIRAQQRQLETLQRGQQENATASSASNAENAEAGTVVAVVDEGTAVSDRSVSLNRPPLMSRHSSNANHSPAPRHTPGLDGHRASNDYFLPSPVETSSRRSSIRDESAFYQAETASLTRENQMLKIRIRELEKQLNEVTAKQANSPSSSSALATSPVLRARSPTEDR